MAQSAWLTIEVIASASSTITGEGPVMASPRARCAAAAASTRSSP
ncbi:MAG: hypothetical protein R2755_18280 [Acidimicrobiales bacterium]